MGPQPAALSFHWHLCGRAAGGHTLPGTDSKDRYVCDRHLWPQEEGGLAPLLGSMRFCGCSIEGWDSSSVYNMVQKSTVAADTWGGGRGAFEGSG